jgi:phage shock protein PspC (stress-responsive transcriptional regulator)
MPRRAPGQNIEAMSETTPPSHAESTARDTADGARGPSDAATDASDAAGSGAGQAEDALGAAAGTAGGQAAAPGGSGPAEAAPGAAGGAEGPGGVGGGPTGATPPPGGGPAGATPPPGGYGPPPGSPPPWGWGQRGGDGPGGGIRQLRRSRTDRKLAGVCGGLGAYTNVDPIIFRVLFAVFSLFGGFGLLLYGVAWLFIPEEDDDRSEAQHLFRDGRTSAGALWAIAATVVGLLIFVAIAANEWDVVFWLLIGSAITFIVLRSRNPQPSQVGPWWTAPPPPAAGPPAPPSSPTAAPGETAPPAGTATPWGTAGPAGTAAPAATAPGQAPSEATATGYGGALAQDPYTTQGRYATQGQYSAQSPAAAAGYSAPGGQWAAQATHLGTEQQWQPQPEWQPQWQPQPPPPPTPAKPRESSPVPWLTLSAALVVGGILGALDLADVIDVSAEAIAATILIIFGVGLVVSAWIGRARSLIGLGLATLVALVVIAAVDVPLSGGFGERHVEPVSTSEFGDPVRLTAGKITIDLTRFNDPSATGVLDASVGAGEIVVIYPDDIRLEATADVSAGDINRDLADDIRVNGESVVHDPVGASKGTVRLNLDIGAGNIRFEEAGRATP